MADKASRSEDEGLFDELGCSGRGAASFPAVLFGYSPVLAMV